MKNINSTKSILKFSSRRKIINPKFTFEIKFLCQFDKNKNNNINKEVHKAYRSNQMCNNQNNLNLIKDLIESKATEKCIFIF